MLKELTRKSRSYRRFYQEARISREELESLIGLARLAPSTANSQALKYKICCGAQECEKVYPALGWAAALPDWPGPKEGEKPAAYIVILCDLSLGRNKMIDDGIAAQTILLGAAEMGYGGCIIANIQRLQLAEAIGIDLDKYSIDLVLALGKPKESVEIVPVGEDGSTRYYRDENQVHYVPKRSLRDLII